MSKSDKQKNFPVERKKNRKCFLQNLYEKNIMKKEKQKERNLFRKNKKRKVWKERK